MKYSSLIFPLLFQVVSVFAQPAPDPETQAMVQRLQKLVEEGDPRLYYHWNGRLAALMREELEEGFDGVLWYQYCYETLNAGDSQRCIGEIESYLETQKLTYQDLLQDRGRPLLELLGLAYLRLGEQQNCQNQHTPYACILPLKAPAIHQLPQGSEKAAAIFSLLYQRYPDPTYQWLTNLSYMTLGKYPSAVPQELLIPFPQDEMTNFPFFREIASPLGVAVNGLSGGVCLEDVNQDGWIDIFATSYGMEDQVELFLADQKGGFYRHTDASGLMGIVSGLNCKQADYDNDGDVDILILRGGWLSASGNHPNSLLQNNGEGTFRDVTQSAGLLTFHPTQTAAWADVNKDGYLDVFIGNESQEGLLHPCELFINQQDGTFREMAEEWGIGDLHAFVKGVDFGDINGDQWPDLFISVNGGPNLLFKNNGQQFIDISRSAGVEEPIYSFPCWFWDVNQDGLQDIFVSGYDTRNLDGVAGDYASELQGQPIQTAKPRLFLNHGDETFADATIPYGLDKSMYSMGANFGDLDNDGYPDFYVGTGAPDFKTVVPNRMFRNVEGQRFEEVTSMGGFGHIQKGHGVGFADLDHDGDQDIYAVMGGAYEGDVFSNVLFENPILQHHWLVLQLRGTKTNRLGVGSMIEVVLADGRKIYHTVGTGASFGGNSLQAEIGLGQAQKIFEVIVHWQAGGVQVYSNIKINQAYQLVEGQTKAKKLTYEAVKWDFQDTPKADPHRH
ncbi:MAG: CRTAC1 family protein [Bacteroidota bacterium]